MTSSSPLAAATQSKGPSPLITIIRIVVLLGLLYLLLSAVTLIGGGFKLASGGKSTAAEILQASNPFVGLILGIFATAIVQSSSTVTTIIVGMVAGGQIGVSMAVPMIMGANIGTTVTNTLVSLGHITRKSEFRRAFAAATVHDMFNFLAVIIFLPLELITRQITGIGILEFLASHMAQWILPWTGGEKGGKSFIKVATKAFYALFYHVDKGTGNITGLYAGLPSLWAGIAIIATGLVLIFTSILYMGKLLKAALQGKAEQIFHKAMGQGALLSIGVGALITVMVQSSSTTTSLIVPMAGAGLMTLRQVFPFTLGANIGTTITALLASMAGSDNPEWALAALTIALVHLLFNVCATAFIYGVPWLRAMPLKASEYMADLAINRRPLAIGYILVAYFVIPFLVFLGYRAMSGTAVPEVPASTTTTSTTSAAMTPTPDLPSPSATTSSGAP